MKAWIVTDGVAFHRVQAAEPDEAFRISDGMVDLARAQCWELGYEEGVEVQREPRYKWTQGRAAIDLPYEIGVTDPTWHDDEPDTVDRPTAPADRNKAVIMLGYGVSRPLFYRYVAHHPDAEIWTLNADRMKGATRHFQTHTWDALKHASNAAEIADTSDLQIPVYTQENYPFDKVRRLYHCSSVDYMLAIADLEGFGIVCMPGLDFGGARRPTELHSARYWVGVLEGKGAKVRRSPLSLMFRHIRYGAVTVEELEAFDGKVLYR